MSFNPANFARVNSIISGTYQFTYTTADSLSDVAGSGYFNDPHASGQLRSGDFVAITASDGKSLAMSTGSGMQGIAARIDLFWEIA